MRFFTSEWARGEDHDHDPVSQYQRFLDTLDPASPVHQFVMSVNLNDAILDRAVYDSMQKSLQLFLITGDLQVGYWSTEINYVDAEINGRIVLSDALDDRRSEILYDEFSLEGNGFLHQFLLVPKTRRKTEDQEFGIRFSSFSYRQRSINERAVTALENVSVWR